MSPLKGLLHLIIYTKIIIIIIYCLTSDSDPYWAYADYFLFTCREKTLLERKPRNPSPY